VLCVCLWGVFGGWIYHFLYLFSFASFSLFGSIYPLCAVFFLEGREEFKIYFPELYRFS
jgi:hypothetical protein